MATETTTEEDIYEALEEVIDPELGLDFVSLGLVYEVEIEDSNVYVNFTPTYPGCPIGPQVSLHTGQDVRGRQVRAGFLSAYIWASLAVNRTGDRSGAHRRDDRPLLSIQG